MKRFLRSKFALLLTVLTLIAAAIAIPLISSRVHVYAQAPGGRDRVEQELATLVGSSLPAIGSDTVAPVEPITIGFRSGNRVGIRTPGVIAVHDITRNTDGAVRKIPNGTQALAILRSKDAPTDITYVVSGQDVQLSLDVLGGVGIARADGTRVGRISAPWATDATGKSLPTSYSVNGHTITQHVNTAGATFPVVADPHYTWGWISGTVYFNRSETRDISYGLGGLAAAGVFLPPPFDAIVGGISGIMAAEAAIAENHGWCIYVNTYRQVGFYHGSQGNGYCR